MKSKVNARVDRCEVKKERNRCWLMKFDEMKSFNEWLMFSTCIARSFMIWLIDFDFEAFGVNG